MKRLIDEAVYPVVQWFPEAVVLGANCRKVHFCGYFTILQRIKLTNHCPFRILVLNDNGCVAYGSIARHLELCFRDCVLLLLRRSNSGRVWSYSVLWCLVSRSFEWSLWWLTTVYFIIHREGMARWWFAIIAQRWYSINWTFKPKSGTILPFLHLCFSFTSI